MKRYNPLSPVQNSRVWGEGDPSIFHPLGPILHLRSSHQMHLSQVDNTVTTTSSAAYSNRPSGRVAEIEP